MSRYGSNKEAIFCWALIKYPNILQDALQLKLANIELENRAGGKKTDISAVDSKRRLHILIEVQVTKSNDRYLERIKGMIEANQEAVIVWIANEFVDNHVKQIEEWLRVKNKRYIDFYALQIDPQVMPLLIELNDLYKLAIYDELYKIREIENVITSYHTMKQIPDNYIGQAQIRKYEYNYSRIEDVKKALLCVLRERMPYFLNFYYNKKAYIHDHILNVGAGLAGLNYRCAVKNRNGLAFVELYFDISKIDMYEKFQTLKKQMKERINSNITFVDRKIGIYFAPPETYEKTFEVIAKLFERFLLFFSPYIYQQKEIKNEGMELKKSLVNCDIDYETNIMPAQQENHIETEESYRITIEVRADYYLYR